MKRALFLLRVAVGVFGLLVVALGFIVPPTRGSFAMVIAGGAVIFFLRELTWHDRYDAIRDLVPSPSNPREMLIDSASEKLKDETGAALYRCFEFEYPMLECPRRPFRRILARHRDQLVANLPALPFLLRKQSVTVDLLTRVEEYACVIDASTGGASPVTIRSRCTAAIRDFREFLRVARRLNERADPGTMAAIVLDDDAVSLHTLAVTEQSLPDGTRQRSFALSPEELTFDPRHQCVERYGYVVIRAWRPNAKAQWREDRITMRPAARSREEYIDRLLTASRAVIRESLERHVRHGGPTTRLLVSVASYREMGPRARIVSVDRDGWHKTLKRFPECERLLASSWRAGWMPVFLSAEDFGGIRWIAVGGEGRDGEPPPNATEANHGGARYPERVYDRSG